MCRPLFLLPLVLMGVGCSAEYQVGVNGFASPETPQIQKGASIVVVDDEEAENPIFHNEVGRKIEKLLRSEGYVISTEENADYYLFLAYGVGRGKTRTGMLPIHEPGGVAAASAFNSYGGSSYSTVQMPSSTHYVPYSIEQFDRWLRIRVIDGREYRTTGEAKVVWLAETTSSGRSPDLREVIDYMLVPTVEHFGENTGKRIGHVLSSSTKKVKQLNEN